MNSIQILTGRIEDVITLLEGIPEFQPVPSKEDILQRIGLSRHLILTANVENDPVGFKIGYERGEGFYSWLGAVHPTFRRQGVATSLADYQESWAKSQGYPSIWMKTRNRFPNMLRMAIKRGFRITGFDEREEISEHRIILIKSI